MARIRVTTYAKEDKTPKRVHIDSPNNTGNPLAYIGQRALIGLAGVGEGIGKFAEGTVAWLSGNENYAKYVFETSKTGEWRTSLDDQFNPDLFMQTLGAAGEGVGQSSAFLLNAAVPFLGTGMFATSVVGNSVGNAVAMTGDLGLKEYGYGITIGAAESFLETIVGAGSQVAKTVATKGATTAAKSLGKATVARAARNGVWKNVIKESAGEFMEEFLGDYVDVAAQKGWGVNKDAQYSIYNALYSGLVGAISGAAMGGTVELGNAAIHTRAGARVQKNGNVETLMKQANAVADSFGTMGGGRTKRTKMNQYIASIQASTDAYNRLSDEAKAGNRGALYLGEIEAAVFGLQSAYGVMQAEDAIDKNAEAYADYASKISGKTYTAEDIRANKDNMKSTLAVLRFTGDFMTASEAEQTENRIKEIIRQESKSESEAAAQFVEMGFSAEDAADAASRQTYTEGMTPISESGKWNGESIAYKMPSGEFAFVFDNGDGTYNVGIGATEDFESGKIRIANQTREEVVDFLARVEENRILADRVKRETVAEAETEAESAESQTSEEAEDASQSTETKDDESTDEKEPERGESDNAELNPERKASLKKEESADTSSSETKEESETEKEREEEEAELEAVKKKRTELAAMQDRARKAVAGFDSLPYEKRHAIEAMYRSAEESGADGNAADAAAHLLAILPNLQIHFSDKIGKNGIYDRISENERVIILNSKTDADGGATQTLLHEVTHTIEGNAGYKELSKLATELFGEEKANEVRSRYREYAKQQNITMSDEYIEQEVTAEAVGELLAKGKYVARMRNRSGIVNAVMQMGRWARTLVGKNKAARSAALKLQTAFTKCLARTPEEASEVMKKYSFGGTNARTADKQKLSHAQELLENGVDEETVRKETGWFKGYDGKWRFEIDDSEMEVRGPDSNYTTLVKLIRHRALFEAYPQLRQMAVTFSDLGENRGSYSRTFGDIELNISLKNDAKELKSTLVHEIQHAIQDIEGFAKGANVEYWEKRLLEGFDSRTDFVRKQEKEILDRIEEMRLEDANNDTSFVEDMERLSSMVPDHPRGAIDWDTLEQLEEDSPAWQAYDRQRDEYSEQYGEDRVFEFAEMEYHLELLKAKGERFASDLYYDTAGEIEARDVSKRREYSSEQRKNTRPNIDRTDVVFAESSDKSLSIEVAENGKPVVVVRDDITKLAANNKALVKLVKQSIGRLPYVAIGRQQIKFLYDTKREVTYSKYTQWLRKNAPDVYKDKMRLFNHPSEVVLATTDYINEGLNHTRTDDIVDFVRGELLIDVLGKQYSAEVVIGFTKAGVCELHDVVNMTPTSFGYKTRDALSAISHDGEHSQKRSSLGNSISQPDDSVKRKFSLSREGVKDTERDYEGNELTEEQQAFFKDSKVRLDEDGDWWYGEGRLAPVYHSSYDEFYTFSKEFLGKMTDGNASDDYLAATAHLGFWFNTQNLTEKGSSGYSNGRAMKCYLNLTKPYQAGTLESLAAEIETYCAERFDEEATPAEKGEAFALKLAWEGYDGIIISDEEFGGISFVAFEPEQIKDVGNKTPTSNPDIRYSLPKQSSELNKARREARTQANRAEREQARADRIKAELELYKDHQIDSSVIVEYADRQLSTYNGKLPKDRLRELFLNLAARLEHLSSHPKAKDADRLIGDINADLEVLAEEIAYHQKTEVSDEVKEIRKWVKAHKLTLPDELKGDLDRFGGEGSFRQKFRGKIVLSDDGIAVDSIYPELTELFGEGYFSSDITNAADQLFRIADVVSDEGNAYQSVDLDEMASVLREQYYADLTELLHDKRNARKGQEAILREEIQQLKAVNRAVENTALQEGYTRGYADALGKKEKAYSKTDAANTVERMIETLDRWSGVTGYYADYRSDYTKSYLSRRIFFLMNSVSRAGMDNRAQMLADNFIRELEFAEPYTGQDTYEGKTLLAWELQEIWGDAVESLRIQLANEIMNAYDELGKLTPAAKERREKRAVTERLLQEKVAMAREMGLVARVKSLEELASGRTKPSDKIDLEEMQAIAKMFSQTVVNGRISVKRVREFAGWFVRMLDGEARTGTQQYLKEMIYAGTLADLRDIADGDAQSLTVHQISALNNLYIEFKNAYHTYRKVKIDGEWQEAVPIAQKGVKQAQGSFIGANNRKGKLSGLKRKTIEFLIYSQDPLRTVAMLEGWCGDGVLSKLMYDIVVGEALRISLEMEFMEKFDEFFKKHDKYQKRLAEKTFVSKYFGVEMTIGEAISLWLTAKREQAKKGLANSDIIFSRGEMGKRVAEGGWKKWSELSEEERLDRLTGGLTELYKAFNAEDLEFIAITEKFFNKISTEAKRRADIDYYGHEMKMESYYFPISRDSSSIAEELTDASKAIANFITVSNLSFNKATKQYAEKPLYITNVWNVITNHAKGLSAYATMYRPLLNFNTIWNTQTSGNKNSPESMKSVYNDEVWSGMSKYLSKLMNDVQGISGEKSPLDGAFSKLRSNAVIFQLGLNPKTWLTQWTSLLAALDTLSPASLAKGVMIGSKEHDAEMDKYSLYARTRDYNMEVVKAEGVVDKIGKWGERSMTPISTMDRMVIRRLWGACQVEVETKQGLAIGSQANMEAAGKLLDTVILRTQQTAGASTRSAFMRGSELTRSLTMFSSDAMKQLSCMVERMGRFQRARIDAKNGVAGASERLTEAKKDLAKTGGSVLAVAIACAAIAQLFKGLYDRERRKKRDGSEMSIAEDVAMDSVGNVVSILPIVREIYDYLDSGYEITNFTLDAMNDVIGSFIQITDDVTAAAMGEYVPQEDIANDARQALYAAGMVLGVPVRNFNNILEGAMNVTIDEWHWGYKSLFKKPSYEQDLQEAIDEGDESLAQLILTTWMEREKVGEVGDEIDKLMELYLKGYDFLPSNIPSSVDGHAVTAKERKELVAAMSEAEQQAAEMILSSSWQGLSEEAQAEALKQLYRNRQTVAKNELFGSELNRKAILSKLYGYQPVAEISGLAAATEPIEEDGREITKREQIEEGLKAYTGDEAIMLYIAGYTSEEARDALKAAIYQTSSDEKERKALLEKLGIKEEEAE